MGVGVVCGGDKERLLRRLLKGLLTGSRGIGGWYYGGRGIPGLVLNARACIHPTPYTAQGRCPGPTVGGFAPGTQPVGRAGEYSGCGVVWCGVVWCGVVWCGVVWCGVVWCGVVWCGVVWCGVVWCGVVWCGVVWCGEVPCGVALASDTVAVLRTPKRRDTQALLRGLYAWPASSWLSSATLVEGPDNTAPPHTISHTPHNTTPSPLKQGLWQSGC